MPLKKITLKTAQEHRNLRLDQVLAECLPSALSQPISKGRVRKLIVAGAVYLNGKRVRIASKEIMPHAKLEIFVDLEKLNQNSTSKDSPFLMTEEHILFEDDYIIAVNKPSGLPTQPTLDEARDNLYAAVKKYLAKREGNITSGVYLGLHHRLDRDTSGVILFTKAVEANQGIAASFSGHTAVKIYQALTARHCTVQVEESWSVKNFLGRLKSQGKRAKYGSVRSGGSSAHTDFKLLESMENGMWIEARPHTGRTHQIRVHLSEKGLPILGDALYGGPLQVKNWRIPRVMLHAVSLTFPHPIHDHNISIQSSLPEDFKECLKALQKGSFDL